jgi:hypothetical protein
MEAGSSPSKFFNMPRLINTWRRYESSLREYPGLVFQHWLFLFVSIGAFLVGLVQEFATTLALPTWAWVAIGVVALALAQFRAFHDVRLSRDIAQARVVQLEARPEFPDCDVRLMDMWRESDVERQREASGDQQYRNFVPIYAKVEITNREPDAVSLRCQVVFHNQADTFSALWPQKQPPFNIARRSTTQETFHVIADKTVLPVFAEGKAELPHARLVRILAQDLLSGAEKMFEARPTP